MKDMINYYYNLDNIRIIPFDGNNEQDSLKNYQYYIEANNTKYVLKKVNYETATLNYNVINQLKGIKHFLEPVFNINNEIITRINNQGYVLLRCNNTPNEKICLFDIKTDYYINGYSFDINTWIRMWENKIDSFETWLCEKKTQYSEYIALFHYFIGVSENALLYLKEIKSGNSNMHISNCVASHRRIMIDTTLYEYYDSTSIIPDHPSRDIAEYIKAVIINRDFDINVFDNYLGKKTFTKLDISILYARIIFPTFFYDAVEEGGKQFHKLINSIDYYEKCMIEINKLFSDKWNIKIIGWLHNKKNQG